jgi:hypothetical protein
MPQIEQDVQKVLEEISASPLQGNTAWTQSIMNSLTALAYDRHKFYVYGKKCNNVDDTITGCLYDMVWYTPKDLSYLSRKNIIFDKIHMVLECEWKKDMDEIMYDFQKLVQARADHRVMIFESYETDKTITIDNLIHYVESSPHSVKGDRYLIAAWRDKNWKFDFITHVKS